MRISESQPPERSRWPRVTLSDCLGLIAACAIGCALLRSGGPLRPTVQNPMAIVLFICLSALGSGPFVMLPRVLPSGWRTMASTESAWLFFGLAVDIFLVVVVFQRPARLGWPALLAAPVVLFGLADFVGRAMIPASKRPAPTPTGTHKFSVTIWLGTLFILFLCLIFSLILLAFA